jgi:hypothetical protein
MFHRGNRTFTGGIQADLNSMINKVLDEFMEEVKHLVEKHKVRNAVVRSMLPCNLLMILDDANLSIVAQKSLASLNTRFVHNRGISHSTDAICDIARWDFGFDEPFVIRFPAEILSEDTTERREALSAIASEHVDSEIRRARKEMNIIQLNPLFGPASFEVDSKLVFVLMPFDDDLTEIYKSVVKIAIEDSGLGLVCRRADDYKTNKAIVQDIWKAICEARVILADLTRLNPNVMYELGMAHTVGKETILIYQKSQQIAFPFDLAHIRRIEYVNNAPGGQKLKHELIETLKYVLNPSVQA